MPAADFLARAKRFYPVLAFFGGFAWDALTLGRRVTALDFWRLGLSLLLAGLLILWLARRDFRGAPEPRPESGWRGQARVLRWLAPYLGVQFLFGAVFSALFILYFKSSGHVGAWLTAAILGALLVGNEFVGKRYGRRFTLTWGLFGLNAILLMNFALPHLAGSLEPAWFYASTGAGAALAHMLHTVAPGRPGRILPAWGVAAALLLAWRLDMIAPVPLVKRDLVVGTQFSQQQGAYRLQVEPAPAWQFWRDQAAVVQVPPGERLYGVSAVFAPRGVSAPLEHRWERREPEGAWRVVSRIRFTASGGRERGFRGYSWVSDPAPGDWRLIAATQDGRTIATLDFRVEKANPEPNTLSWREY